MKEEVKPLRRQSGFTGVEMLIVVLAIVILVGLLWPMFKRVRDSAKKTYCLSNLKQLGVAVQLYLQDDGQGRFPGWGTGVNEYDEVKELPNLLWHYLGQENENVLQSGEMNQFRCPANFSTLNLSERVDTWGNQVDYAINRNVWNKSEVSVIRNDMLAVVLYDTPPYPDAAGSQIHVGGTNFLFADGHVTWLSRNRINTSWPNAQAQDAGNSYEDWGLI
ncbi:MAG: hypothetical protein HYS08_08500 [Chlamydiae bacterium]|nr:hypothetical protein [Chlamydiota bacterium]